MKMKMQILQSIRARPCLHSALLYVSLNDFLNAFLWWINVSEYIADKKKSHYPDYKKTEQIIKSAGKLFFYDK